MSLSPVQTGLVNLAGQRQEPVGKVRCMARCDLRQGTKKERERSKARDFRGDDNEDPLALCVGKDEG
ncbi:hypothetical protein PG991_006746 [Apiospora marii]|uniref:Uncharacterized protein n=1 Tax=Apiospora marii TaxID=335849 RepID=A0ABR1RZK7_9PEZI